MLHLDIQDLNESVNENSEGAEKVGMANLQKVVWDSSSINSGRYYWEFF